ncbi:MAG: OmpR family two-component response regulator [Parcubacteria group bacterium GW2011_GWB1_45_9]|nr:MAG: OmpR family two-component response regulator [Parcubacteria group bacterium GW2011_GWB1_45_9]
MEEGKKILLIVEDEKPVLKALVDKFGVEGFGVLTAENGEDGLKVALDEKPDLILLDLIMPKKTGLEMMHELRKDPDYGKKVPIIILTNLSANDKVSGEVSEEEPSYYLVKADWKIEDVVRKVKETLGMIEK